MANPPKAKGTRAETELLRLLQATPGFEHLVRTPASSRVDLMSPGEPKVEALATRPDKGQWLFTIDLPTFLTLAREKPLAIEVKRYKSFAHHRIFEEKFA